MHNINISPVSKQDIPAIALLQSDLLLKNNENAEKGFLVSGYTEEEYYKFLDSYEFFYKATIDGKIAGCLMAFNSESILPEDETNQMLKQCAKEEFVLIKQVFVSRNHGRKGIADLLYNHLSKQIKSERALIAVIVSEPLNIPSIKFHEKMGFQEYMWFYPKKDKDGKVRKRSAWICLPKNGSLLLDHVRFTNIEMDEDIGEIMLARSTQMSNLYTHEDNLNWTKLGMQITLLLAFVAAFAFFYEKSLTKSAFPVLLPLALWGGIINYVFYVKVRSGIKFLTVHKNNLIDLDKKIKFYFPIVNSLFPEGTKTSEKSKSVKLLPNVSLFGIFIWAFISFLLILKAFGIFSAF